MRKLNFKAVILAITLAVLSIGISCRRHDMGTEPKCTRGNSPRCNLYAMVGSTVGASHSTCIQEIAYRGDHWIMTFNIYLDEYLQQHWDHVNGLYKIVVFESEDECTYWHETKYWYAKSGWHYK